MDDDPWAYRGPDPAAEMSGALVVVTSGFCVSQFGTGGWIWYVSEDCWGCGLHPRSTTSLMQLRAVHETLSIIPVKTPFIIRTDNTYIVSTFNTWVKHWKTNGWITSAGNPVKHPGVIKQIDNQLQGRKVSFAHTPAKSGDPLLKSAVTLLKTAVETGMQEKPVRTGPGFDPEAAEAARARRALESE